MTDHLTPETDAGAYERRTLRRSMDRIGWVRAILAMGIGVVSGLVSVWAALGGTFTTPAAAMTKHIETERSTNIRQDSMISTLIAGLTEETALRKAADSALAGRANVDRYYLRFLAIDRCVSRRLSGYVPPQLEPYCDRLNRGEDLPNPLTP